MTHRSAAPTDRPTSGRKAERTVGGRGGTTGRLGKEPLLGAARGAVAREVHDHREEEREYAGPREHGKREGSGVGRVVVCREVRLPAQVVEPGYGRREAGVQSLRGRAGPQGLALPLPRGQRGGHLRLRWL